MENINEVQAIPVKKERQTGFEILSILAMILLCAVHIMGFGGMIGNSSGGGKCGTSLAKTFICNIHSFC